MSRALEDRIAEIAVAQHGVLTRAQAGAVGLTPGTIERRLASGRLRLLHRGVYLTLPFPLPHTRYMAAVLASGPGAALSHLSAGSMRKLCGAVAGPVDVIVTAHRGDRPGIRSHRVGALRDDERTVTEGIPITTPARTLVDLARLLDTRDLECAVARAERDGLVTPEALACLVERHAGLPGVPALRAILQLADGPALTRSELEEAFLALVVEAGLPRPGCNVRIGRHELDFLFRAEAVGVEVDGFRYHSSRRSFEGDRRKDAQLLAAGITVLRLSWRQITDERLATAVLLDRVLHGGRNPGKPRM